MLFSFGMLLILCGLGIMGFGLFIFYAWLPLFYGLLGFEIGLLLGLITVAAVGSTAASGLVAWSGWRLAPTPADGTGFAAESSRLLCLVGLLLSGLFTTLVLLGGISPLVLPPCTAT